MEHTKEFEELNRKSLEKYEEYLKTKANLDKQHQEKLSEARRNGKVPGQVLWICLCISKRLKYNYHLCLITLILSFPKI